MNSNNNVSTSHLFGTDRSCFEYLKYAIRCNFLACSIAPTNEEGRNERCPMCSQHSHQSTHIRHRSHFCSYSEHDPFNRIDRVSFSEESKLPLPYKPFSELSACSVLLQTESKTKRKIIGLKIGLYYVRTIFSFRIFFYLYVWRMSFSIIYSIVSMFDASSCYHFGTNRYKSISAFYQNSSLKLHLYWMFSQISKSDRDIWKLKWKKFVGICN